MSQNKKINTVKEVNSRMIPYQIRCGIHCLQNIENDKFSSMSVRFLAMWTTSKVVSHRIFAKLCNEPDIVEILARQRIKGPIQLHRYMQLKFIDYMNTLA
jgi:hypothetical protein